MKERPLVETTCSSLINVVEWTRRKGPCLLATLEAAWTSIVLARASGLAFEHSKESSSSMPSSSNRDIWHQEGSNEMHILSNQMTH